ncbi:MAG: acyltransferase [Nitrospirae bacterium]|nr:acyltransferase [Nitrospirota bacterium]
MLEQLIHSYESVKMPVENPDAVNLIILALLVCIAVFSLRRTESASFLDRDQTDQLKGIAILLIMLGHLWVHVSQKKAGLIMSGDGLALFLMLSGYGLTRSIQKRVPTFRDFMSRRVNRVMLPYWIVSFFLLFLDYALLEKSYSLKDIALTLIGINVTQTTQHIDYVRWFMTFLLFWYAVFYITVSRISSKKPAIFLIICAMVLFVAERRLGWYQLFAFPVGCAIGQYHGKIQALFMKENKKIFISAAAVFIVVLISKIYVLNYLGKHWRYDIFKAVDELVSILFNSSLIIMTAFYSYKNYYSVFLRFCGSVSYELFLLHGYFMIKYNPSFGLMNVTMLPVTFFIFLSLVLSLSYITHKITVIKCA